MSTVAWRIFAPVVLAENAQSLSNRLVETLRRDLDRMLVALRVPHLTLMFGPRFPNLAGSCFVRYDDHGLRGRHATNVGLASVVVTIKQPEVEHRVRIRVLKIGSIQLAEVLLKWR